MTSHGTLRTIDAAAITDAVEQLYRTANLQVPAEMRQAMERALTREASPEGRDTLEKLLKNYDAAAATGLPMCQDTGLAVMLVEVGQKLCIQGDLNAAIHEGVRRGCRAGYLRTSVVAHSAASRQYRRQYPPPSSTWRWCRATACA